MPHWLGLLVRRTVRVPPEKILEVAWCEAPFPLDVNSAQIAKFDPGAHDDLADFQKVGHAPTRQILTAQNLTSLDRISGFKSHVMPI